MRAAAAAATAAEINFVFVSDNDNPSASIAVSFRPTYGGWSVRCASRTVVKSVDRMCPASVAAAAVKVCKRSSHHLKVRMMQDH